MFAEPQTITISTVAKTLPRVSFGNRDGSFESVVDGLRLRITHIVGKRIRRMVRLDSTKTAADPLLDGVSRQYSSSVHLTIDHPPVGFSAAELTANVKGLADWLSVPANVAKLVGGES